MFSVHLSLASKLHKHMLYPGGREGRGGLVEAARAQQLSGYILPFGDL